VAGKVANSRSMAGRIARRSRFEKMKLGRLKAVLDGADGRIQAAQSLDTLRGVEGSAARAYFAILRSALNWPEDIPARRTRRPPRDPVNAMLSLGYSLLTNAMFSACEVVGLDPYDGFFHADAYGRPGLALDLVEEFRVPVVDSLVLTLVNKRMLTPNEFEADDEGPGVWLTEKGRKVFFSQFSRRLQTAILHPRAGRAISYQKCLEVQARELRKLLEGERDSYTPFRIR
jgi:CRISPR-associated protein Cas1